LTSLIPV